MPDSGQFDRVYSEDNLSEYSMKKYHEASQRKRFVIFIVSSVLFTASLCCFYECLNEMNTLQLECLTESDYFGKYLSSFLVELFSAIFGILSSIFTFIILILPFITGPEIMEQPKIASLISIVTLGHGSKSPMKTWVLFTIQLVGIASCFGSLMSITTCTIKLVTSMRQIPVNIDENLTQPNILCLIRILLRLTISFISVICILLLLFFLTKYIKLKSKNFNVPIEKPEIKMSHTSKFVPIFSSILIIFGGLALLSCLMGCLSVPRYFRTSNEERKDRFILLAFELTNWLSTLPTGVFAILSGIFCVVSVNCCSIPLYQIEDQQISIRVKNKNFLHIFYYIIALISCIFTQIFSYQGYVMENFQLISKVRFIYQDINQINTEDTDEKVVFHEILQIFYVKIGLGSFSNLFIMLFVMPLLSIVVYEMYVRMSFLKEIKLNSIIKPEMPYYDPPGTQINQMSIDQVRQDNLYLPTGMDTILNKEDNIQFSAPNQMMQNYGMNEIHQQIFDPQTQQPYINPYNAYNYNQSDLNHSNVYSSERHSTQEDAYIIEEMKRAFQNNNYNS